MYSADGEPATVGTQGYDAKLQSIVDKIQQGDGLKLKAKGIHDARTIGRFEAVKIIDRRAIRLFSRPAPTPEPFADLWDDSDGETATGGFQTDDGEYTADIILEPESTELLTMFWNGLIDFEAQFKNRQFGDEHPTDVLIFNNETTDYITILYHADVTETLEEIYQIYLDDYDAQTDTGDQYKAELLYPEYRQFRPDLPDGVPSKAVLTSETNPFPRDSRVEGPPMDRPQSTKRDASAADTNSSAASGNSSSDTVASDEAAADADGDGESEAVDDDQPDWAAGLDRELTHSWSKDSEVTMADYGGRPELTETIRNSVIVPFRDRPEQAKELGVPVPSLLLYGPPGTGKTYLAKALAGEIGYPYVTLSGGDMLSRYINASTENVNELLAEARAPAEHCGRALLSIDEIDSVLKTRQPTNQHAEDQKVVNEFLTQNENIGDHNILFMGATNVHEELDSAALSRFDKELFVGLPEEQTRTEIIATHLSDRAHSVTDEEIADLAAATDGYSARDLTKIVTDAARRTLVDPDRDEITVEACEAALAEFTGSSESE
jgi:AAA+ superfamily predicted ATPase